MVVPPPPTDAQVIAGTIVGVAEDTKENKREETNVVECRRTVPGNRDCAGASVGPRVS